MRGAWTIYDCLLVDRFSKGVGDALTLLVQDERERTRRLKRVGLWSIRSVAKSARSLYEHLKGLKGYAYFSEFGDVFGEPFSNA
jgi:distribution and morphology protein 31